MNFIEFENIILENSLNPIKELKNVWKETKAAKELFIKYKQRKIEKGVSEKNLETFYFFDKIWNNVVIIAPYIYRRIL